MYLDWTYKKMATLAGIICLLFVGVYFTYLGKMNRFGSTPYFYTINVGGKYLLDSLAVRMMDVSRALFAGANAAFEDAPASTRTISAATAPGIPILTYHRVVEDESDENNITTARFRDQMRTLHDAGWQTVTLQEFEDFMAGKIQLPEKSFLLTFDDGAKQSFYPVDPILQQLGYHAAIFIIVESSKTKESTYYLTPQEIQWILKTGRWSIGSHSYDGHRPYAVSPDGSTGIFFADRILNQTTKQLETPEEFTARVRSDLERSKAELEAIYDVPIRTFAFPLGNETGILGANNFPEGASVTDSVAREIYDWGFLQTNNQDYTLNFPKDSSALSHFASTSAALASDFHAYRIHVDYDWDGQRLLGIMENSLSKKLPYEDDFATNKGWISAWGGLETGRNNMQIAAEDTITSSSAFLDGSALWDNYSFDASVAWNRGYALLLADVLHSKTYHSCAFYDGGVRLQRTINGETVTLNEHKDPSITYSDAAQMGIRVHDSVIECTWGYQSVVEDYSRHFSGGIGVQAWDPEVGSAALTVSSIIVRPYTSD